jgi:hypothetical protein
MFRVKIKVGADCLRSYPWLAHKEWWKVASYTDAGSLLNDPESPTAFEFVWIAKHDIQEAQVIEHEAQYYGLISGDDMGTLNFPKPVQIMASGSVSLPTIGGVQMGAGLYWGPKGCAISNEPMDKGRNMQDLRIDECRVDFETGYLQDYQNISVKKLKIDPNSTYGQALKGLLKLNGLHLKFKKTGATLDCIEYHDVPCMALASIKEFECFDMYQAEYNQSLLGLLIPTEFLV